MLSPSPSLSRTLISSSVVSSRLNANSEEAGRAFHSHRSFVIKSPCRQALCTGAGACRLFETGKIRSPGWPRLLRAAPALASTRTHTLTQVRAESLRQIAPKQYLCFWPAVCVPGCNAKENTQRTEHKEMLKQAAAHTSQFCR